MKKKYIALVIALALMLPSGAQATDWEFSNRDMEGTYDAKDAVYVALSEDNVQISGSGASYRDGVIAISDEGTYVFSGTLNGGRIAVEAGKKDKVQIVLNSADIYCEDYAALYIDEADKVFVTLAEGTENRLASGENYALSGDDNTDGAVFSRADITFNGAGALTVEGNYEHGIVSKDDLTITGGSYTISSVGHGIVGKDCVKIANGAFVIRAGSDGIQSDNDEDAGRGFVYIQNGSFVIESGADGIQAESMLVIENGAFTITTGGGSADYSAPETNGGWSLFGGWGTQAKTDTQSAKGIKAGGDLNIAGGTFSLDCLDDGLHAGGNLTVQNGVIDVMTGDDGVHADAELIVNGGNLNVSRSYEGLEGGAVTINGGIINLVSSDDGINSAGGNDASGMGGRMGGGRFDITEGCNITINGGEITIDASGDGIDANDSIYVNGGVTYVNGPTNSGNGALDYAAEAVANGGTMFAAGAAGMATGFSQTSGQGVYFAGVSAEAGQLVEIADEEGKVLASFVPEKAFQSLAATAPGMIPGGNYVILVDGEEASASAGSGFGMPGGNFGGFGGGHGQFGAPGGDAWNPMPDGGSRNWGQIPQMPGGNYGWGTPPQMPGSGETNENSGWTKPDGGRRSMVNDADAV
ncbi:MAG: carbohydrate-binding domain-containing protein [Clostridiales bacterium]|nr:carbohydrate-binding domain-containing protein [Clostridiales bacterium]